MKLMMKHDTHQGRDGPIDKKQTQYCSVCGVEQGEATSTYRAAKALVESHLLVLVVQDLFFFVRRFTPQSERSCADSPVYSEMQSGQQTQ